MQISDIGPKQLPPRGSRQLTVPAEMNDSRKLEVNFSLDHDRWPPIGYADQRDRTVECVRSSPGRRDGDSGRVAAVPGRATAVASIQGSAGPSR